MYDLIYSFVSSYIFSSSSLDTYESEIMGITMNLNQWLSHTATIVVMVLFVCFLISLVIWLFKLVSGFILLK